MSGGTTVQTAKSEPWEQQIPYLTKGFAGAEDLLKGGLPQYYQGQTVAGFDPAQQTAQRATLGYALGPRPQVLQGASEAAQVRGLSGAVNTEVLDPMVESYRNKMMADLTGKTLPGIRQSLVQYQPGGGSRGDIVQANAIAAAQENLQNQVGQLYGRSFEAAQARVPQFQSLYPQTMGAPMGLFGQIGDVGADRRALSQEAINRDIQRHAYQQQAPQAALQQYMANISGDYGSTVQNQPGPLSQLGSVAGIIGSLMG